jgi:hypothetical protein
LEDRAVSINILHHGPSIQPGTGLIVIPQPDVWEGAVTGSAEWQKEFLPVTHESVQQERYKQSLKRQLGFTADEEQAETSH